MDLDNNFLHILKELAKDVGNPLDSRILDPANTSNTLSELLSQPEKDAIKKQAKISAAKPYWENIIW